MWKVIHWKLSRKLKFDYTNKWYMNKSESVPDNETYKIFWNSNGTLYPGQKTRTGDQFREKRICCLEDVNISADLRMKIKENEKKKKTKKKTTKFVEYENNGSSSCNWCAWKDPLKLVKGTGRVVNRRTSRDHTNYSIVKIDQNTEQSPGDRRRLAVSQTLVNDHQLALMWKTWWKFNRNNYINNNNLSNPGLEIRLETKQKASISSKIT